MRKMKRSKIAQEQIKNIKKALKTIHFIIASFPSTFAPTLIFSFVAFLVMPSFNGFVRMMTFNDDSFTAFSVKTFMSEFRYILSFFQN